MEQEKRIQFTVQNNQIDVTAGLQDIAAVACFSCYDHFVLTSDDGFQSFAKDWFAINDKHAHFKFSQVAASCRSIVLDTLTPPASRDTSSLAGRLFLRLDRVQFPIDLSCGNAFCGWASVK